MKVDPISESYASFESLKPVAIDPNSFRFPVQIAWVSIVLCLLPLIIPHQATPDNDPAQIASQLSDRVQNAQQGAEIADHALKILAEDIKHALLEWSSVVITLLGMLVALSHYSITKNATGPIIGTVLLMSGTMDSVHALMATRVIETMVENNILLPITWTISRGFTACILLTGVIWILVGKKQRISFSLFQICILGGGLIVVVVGLASWMISAQTLPDIQFPDHWIGRPFDIPPMLLFAICLPFYWLLFNMQPGFLTATMFISLVPHLFSELYMAFGSKALFDHYFTSAHGLKILSYLLPFMGYILDYRLIFKQVLSQEQRLESMNHALKLAEERYRHINQMMPVGLLLVDSKGIIKEANQHVCDLFGYEMDELTRMNVDQLVPQELRKQHARLREAYSHAPQMRRMAKDNQNLMGQTKQGHLIPLEIGLGPVRLMEGQYIVASIIDISQRVEMLEQLKTKNQQMDEAIKQLSHSNEQLEKFAFICSHDLQEPVRTVFSFTQLLKNNLDPELTEQNRKYLDFVCDGSARALQMIADILTFCRIEQASEKRETVDLAAICNDVKVSLQHTVDQRKAVVEWHKPLPAVNAVRSQLFQLMMNLVSNGIKFNDSATPKVTIRAEQNDSHWLIKIEDNGIGINERYQHKVFEIFQRLNSKSEFPGSGIGLAITKKIAEQYGADIQIDSTLGKGSVFTIVWPKEDSD